MRTKDRLAAALAAAGLPDMANKAAAGHYDDFESPLTFPCIALVADLTAIGTPPARALAFRARQGEFDSTAEEAEAWAMSVDGQATIRELMGRGRRP